MQVEIKNSRFQNINCYKENIGHAFVFNPIQDTSVLIEKSTFADLHGNLVFSAINSTVNFKQDSFSNTTSIKKNLMSMILTKTQVQMVKCNFT